MDILTSPETYRMEPTAHGSGSKSRVRKPKEPAVLIEVAAWREREAQSRDVPRGRVLKDEVVVDIAVRAPASIERLSNLRRCQRLRALALGRRHRRGGQARD